MNVHAHRWGDGGRQRAERTPPLSPPGVRVGWLGFFAPPKRATWKARLRSGIRSADPGCVRFYPEPSRRETYSYNVFQ